MLDRGFMPLLKNCPYQAYESFLKPILQRYRFSLGFLCCFSRLSLCLFVCCLCVFFLFLASSSPPSPAYLLNGPSTILANRTAAPTKPPSLWKSMMTINSANSRAPIGQCLFSFFSVLVLAFFTRPSTYLSRFFCCFFLLFFSEMFMKVLGVTDGAACM
jgi:hypothetical protein